tara:strand:+ start:1358 stop:1768 length:411 start_codon:yes stop_codon:yes gene_type:complete
MQLSLLKRHKVSISIIKLTPLIDVLFILLIFAMLVTDHQKFRQINLSVSTHSNNESQINLDELVIHIRMDGELFIENKRSTLVSILETIKQKQEKKPNISILLSPDKGLPFFKFIKVVDQMRSSGIINFNIIGNGN